MIGFISNNFMLPILDFFYGIVHSYGFAIIALTLIVRFALYPLSAGSIRNMRRMKIAQPVMQKKVKELQERYKDDAVRQREEMNKVYQEYGNPLAGCLPLVVQMPILFALFATLRGSPFADVDYTFNIKAFPAEQVVSVAPETCEAKLQTLYIRRDRRESVVATLPNCDRLGVGATVAPAFTTASGVSVADLFEQSSDRESLQPHLRVDKGDDVVRIGADGQIEAVAPGEATVVASLPGLAKDDGFLFIEALGRVGVRGDNGSIHWDILGMVLFFGASLYVTQLLNGNSTTPSAGGDTDQQAQQQTVQKLTPILFSGMFLFFPLPAGVLMYMVVANIFQTAQTFVLNREPLPENLQKILEEQQASAAATATKDEQRQALPFEKRSKKKEKTSG